ncbi:MAG: potassium channel family protein [Phycisphaerae bacterium]
MLLAFLATMLVIEPLAEEQVVHRAGTILSLTAVLGACIYSLSRNRRTLVLASLLAAVPLYSAWFGVADVSRGWAIGEQVSYAGFLLLTIYTILTYVLRTREVTTDTICGAVCAYLMFGLLLAHLYSMIELFQPGSLAMPAGRRVATAVSPLGVPHFSNFIYYSFVTLCSIGYGDITPAGGLARTLSYIEALCGQLYVAVLIARLVAIHVMPDRRQGGRSTDERRGPERRAG